ncbi:MAG: hypothetical protein KGI62_02440 [Xanthomonadaceae bacterium]|nr:hypothetical protein [Xanthomonadaceae bacterium]
MDGSLAALHEAGHSVARAVRIAGTRKVTGRPEPGWNWIPGLAATSSRPVPE